ncbi:unnamed protein product, partial [Polarella glacialis]
MPPVCTVCVRAEARYTCPRCQVAYCSLACYQGHSGKCTESFFQDQVSEELKSQRATPEERKRLEQVVSSLANLDEPTEEETAQDKEEDNEERLELLAALAESGELRLDDLSEEEVRCFHSELKRGELGRALGAWEPWWQTTAIVDLSSLGDDAADEGDRAVHCSPPPHLCCGGEGDSRQVHPSVALTVIEALYAYVHTLRAFNGDWKWDPLQAAVHMLHLGRGICAHRVYASATEALRAAMSAAAALPGANFGAGLDSLCLGDVATLLRRGVGSCARGLREAAEIVELAADAAEAKAEAARMQKDELSKQMGL